MRVAHEITKAQENQPREKLRDPGIAKDLFPIAEDPRNELFRRRHGSCPNRRRLQRSATQPSLNAM
jgi:hypothetical protein